MDLYNKLKSYLASHGEITYDMGLFDILLELQALVETKAALEKQNEKLLQQVEDLREQNLANTLDQQKEDDPKDEDKGEDDDKIKTPEEIVEEERHGSTKKD